MKGKNKVARGNKGKLAVWVSGIFLVGSLIAMTGGFAYLSQENNLSQKHLSNTDTLRILSQKISTSASETARGKAEAFALLREARNEFESTLNDLGSSAGSATGPAESIGSQLQVIDNAWSALKGEADAILASEESVVSLHDLAINLRDTIPQVQVEYDEVVDILLESGAPADQISLAQRQPWLAERIMTSMSRVLEGSENSIMAADSFARDAKLFGRVLEGMQYGNQAMRINQIADEEAQDRLAEIADMFGFIADSVDEILATTPELFQVRSAADLIFTDSQQMLQQTSILKNTLTAATMARFTNENLVLGAGLIALISLLALAFSLRQLFAYQISQSGFRNQTDQHALQRLIDEINGLANGDLSVSATVTEGFTGELADSINHAIHRLRTLVESLNETVEDVDSSAREVQSNAKALALLNENQAQEINLTSQSVNDISDTMRLVSESAAESAEAASRSADIATSGVKVVRNTINGMRTIKEQIDDTSRKVRQLDESSRQISDILALINDIADQTNILSLNAAIQASSVGEAGRGFALLADEVQRLAERVSSATYQVETLVSNIQNSTGDVIVSMAHTSTEVASGTQQAEDASSVLTEIELVTGHLAEKTRTISDTARHQTDSAAMISKRMLTIRELSSQAVSGTTATAGSVGNLAERARQIRESVSEFRLPEAEQHNAEAYIEQSVGSAIDPEDDHDSELTASA